MESEEEDYVPGESELGRYLEGCQASGGTPISSLPLSKPHPKSNWFNSIYELLTISTFRENFKNLYLKEEFKGLVQIHREMSRQFPNCCQIKEDLESLDLTLEKYLSSQPRGISKALLYIYSICPSFKVTRKCLLTSLFDYCKDCQKILKELSGFTDEIETLIFVTSDYFFELFDNFQRLFESIQQELLYLTNIPSIKALSEEYRMPNIVPDLSLSDFNNKGLESLINYGEILLQQLLEYAFWIILTCTNSQIDNNLDLKPIYSKTNAFQMELNKSWNKYCIFKEGLQKEGDREKYLLGTIPKSARFTKEYNTLQNTILISGKCASLQGIINEIQDRIFLLIQPSGRMNSLTRLELSQLRDQLESEFHSLSIALQLQFKLIDKNFLNKYTKPKLKSSNESQNSKELEPKPNTIKEEVDNDGKECFELIGDHSEEDGEEYEEKMDEYFELDHSQLQKVEYTEISDDSEEKDEEEEGGEVEAKLVLLDQLREVLKPRRAKMVGREKEAYKRLYGRELEEEPKVNEEEELQSNQFILKFNQRFNYLQTNTNPGNDEELSTHSFPKADFMKELCSVLNMNNSNSKFNEKSSDSESD